MGCLCSKGIARVAHKPATERSRELIPEPSPPFLQEPPTYEHATSGLSELPDADRSLYVMRESQLYAVSEASLTEASVSARPALDKHAAPAPAAFNVSVSVGGFSSAQLPGTGLGRVWTKAPPCLGARVATAPCTAPKEQPYMVEQHVKDWLSVAENVGAAAPDEPSVRVHISKVWPESAIT